jgi:heme A synthase
VGSAAGILMLATAATAVGMYIRRRPGKSGMPRGIAFASVAGVLLIAFQGLLGGITVLTGNTPFTVAIHLANALLVLAAAALVALWAGRSFRPEGAPAPARSAGAGSWLVAGAASAYAIVLTGAYVVGTGSGAACSGWPLCGTVVRSGFTDVHMLHRGVVLLGSLAILGTVYVGLRRWRGAPMAAVAYLTAGLLLAEVAVGAAQALLGLPAPLRAAHVALASGVWSGVVLMAWAYWLETRPAAASVRAQRPTLAGAES